MRYERGADNDCWPWQGHIDKTGYGKTGTDWAHRAVYTSIVGPIPDGLHLDHLCRNRACVNPAHLEPISQAENNQRAMTDRKRRPRKCGHRWGPGDCRPCAAARTARWRDKVKAGEVAVPVITCAECRQVAPKCARGICRRCYTRLYKRKVRALPARAGTDPIPVDSKTIGNKSV